MPKVIRQTTTEVAQRIDVGYRVSIGLISLSLSLISLSLGIAILSESGLGFLFAVPPLITESTSSSATAVTLTWTAPGDDGDLGQATSYDIRYATAPITAGNFFSTNAVSSPPTPQPSGSTESYTVTNLSPATTYFFALNASDEVGNVSAISNVATKTTSIATSGCTPTYECSVWSACTNGTQTRTCSVTNGCVTGLDQPIATQVCTPTAGGLPVRVTKHIIVAGVGPGAVPVFRIINPTTKKAVKEVLAFSRTQKTGTNVAVGDVNGDHRAEVVVGSGAGSNPLVKMYSDAGGYITQFNPYPASRYIGVEVAVADVNADGFEEIITVPARGTPQVRVFTYNATTKKFTAIAQSFLLDKNLKSGFFLSAGDLNLDNRAEIVIASRASAKTITVYSLTDKNTFLRVARFSPYNVTFRTGIITSIGDVNGDGRGEILTNGGPGYWSWVKVWNMTGKLLANFYPSSKTFLGGADLTTLDVNADGRDEVITGTYSKGGPGLYVFRYSGVSKKFSRIQNYNVYPATMKSGLRIGSR